MIREDSFITAELSPWWRRGTLITVVGGFAVLIYMSSTAYRAAPPVPRLVVTEADGTLFTGDDIRSGQQVFLKHALMENGSIWGHGGYLGPDYSAQYLHDLAVDSGDALSRKSYNRGADQLNDAERHTVLSQARELLNENRYDAHRGILTFSRPEADSYRAQIERWRKFFSRPENNRGLPAAYITEPEEMRTLTAFFAWAAWASVARRPGKAYSYTNNFPYEPLVGNSATPEAVLWSALSLIALLAGTAAVLFAFGKFRYLGWRGEGARARPQLLPEGATESQKASIKFFLAAMFLFLAQALAGAVTAHYLVDPRSFYGIDLSGIFPSNLTRTWHLQMGIFWIATCFMGGGLFMASSLGEREPRGQRMGITILFCALGVVVVGSLLCEWPAVFQHAGRFWYWIGLQGWEYLDLGRFWQVLLAIGMALWGILLMRGVGAARKDPEKREMSLLFLGAAFAIPVFYLPAFFFGSSTSYTVVDAWRFWIIHLWVEGFFELFATVMVAVLFFRLGMVARQTAARIIYLDAILFLGSGIIGTGHHWYWTGQPGISMALSSVFSAMEPVPLILLTLDAWDFITLSRGEGRGKESPFPHNWTFYFLMSVGFWNFVGAGIFGFLINLPIVSYYEAGTILTPNHGHAALMGVFGMLAIAFVVFALRQVSTDAVWKRTEKYVRVSFWGLNIGLAMMVAMSLFPGGVLQLRDVLANGYWHARSPEFLNLPFMNFIFWIRLPADAVFIAAGIVPLLMATGITYVHMRNVAAKGGV